MVAKRQFLLKAGQVYRHFCFIEEGLLRIFHHRDDKQVTTWFLKERDVAIPMASFFDRVPSQQAIQILEDNTVAYFTYEELQNFLLWKNCLLTLIQFIRFRPSCSNISQVF
jgi:CRP-like cAMP-binding protein